jgi:hypothetical protein
MVAAFMALIILRGNMPIIPMASSVGLNGAIVGGLFYLGIEAITSFGAAAQTEPRQVLVRNNEGRVLSIESRGPPTDDHGFFGGEEEVNEVKSINERLGLTSRQTLDTIKTVMVIALMIQIYIGVAFIIYNWTLLMVVTSRSMEPNLYLGDLIYVKGVAPSKLREGDVITFKPPKYISSP